MVMSKLDEATLQEIATATGGQYFHATDGSELNDLIGALSTLQAGQFESREAVKLVERFQIFLLAAFVVLALAELIPDRVGRRRTRRVTNVLGRVIRAGR
jgi:Ca-activated chloride channel family protein